MRRKMRLLAPMAVLLAFAGHGIGVVPANASSPSRTLGVFRGAANDRAVARWERWIGHPAYRVLDYLARENWDKIAAPTWWVDRWSRSAYRRRVIYSVPMLPDSDGSLGQGATGAYNVYFERLARLLVAHGQGSATIRLGWEFNGDWYRWSAASDPRAFVGFWRQIVTTMRSVSGGRFRFDWSLNLGPNSLPADRAYPGDAYVDYIGADVYDHGWAPGYRHPVKRWRTLMRQPYGLRWHRNFAAAHHKPMTFPEWGLVRRSDGHGGGDDPYFVRRMHDWIARNRVAYHAYFEYDVSDASLRLMTGRFPRAAAVFKRVFGRRRAHRSGSVPT